MDKDGQTFRVTIKVKKPERLLKRSLMCISLL